MTGSEQPPYAIGVDIGATKIAAALVDLTQGAVHAKRIIPSDKRKGGEIALKDTLRLAQSLMTQAQARNLAICGIGLGVPELVDLDGNIKSTYNFRWKGLALQTQFAKLAPTRVESDVRAAARAEMLYGAARASRYSVYVTIGSGISYCLGIDGELYTGAKGNAIHFASSALTLHCGNCGRLQQPVIEDIASGPAMLRRFNALSAERYASTEQLFAAVAAGHGQAVEIVTQAADSLGASIALIVNMLDPEIVILGGGLGLSESLYRERMIASIRRHIWADDVKDLPIRPAALSTDAGIIGAAATAWRYAKSVV